MVSLVMPVWRPHRPWLLEAVRSALDERDCPLELVVVDDGNDEPVADLLAELADPRLVIVRIPHGGVSRALNAGIAHATGDAIRFIAADDVVEPTSTAHLLRLSGPDNAIAYASTLVCDRELRPQKVIEATVQGDVLVECLMGHFTVRIVSMLFPREVVAAAGDFDPDFEVNGDYDFVLRAIEHAPVRGDRTIVTRYRRHGASITAGDHAGKKRDMQALDKLFERRPDLRGTKLERTARAHLHVVAARQLVLARRYGRAARELTTALRLDPTGATPQAGGVVASIPGAFARRARGWVSRRVKRARAG
jgi:glycosyltransferase involved in cell wall biosynthesis